jgi:anti-anti-sigma factor
VVIELIGEHDLATSAKLHEVLASLIAANNLVVADLSETEFIDCSGLRAVVKAHRQAEQHGVEFRLQLGARAIVRRTLEISNLLEQIPCFPTRAEALEGTAASV